MHDIECRIALQEPYPQRTICSKSRKEFQCLKVNEGEPARALSVSVSVCECCQTTMWLASLSQLRPPDLPISHLGPLPQRLPLYLPRRTLRYLVHKNHPARQVFVLRDFGLDPLLYLLLARRSLGIELDVGSRMFLGAERFLHADDATIGDGRVGEEDGFELGGSDLEAGDLDEFLFAKIDQRQVLPNPVLKG